ncbi:hypothetical protein G6F45_013920 [Rhizopus arrhizus]|nr:hypothetical protein G6F45_013920 [Rhizopus arrhizus]
MFPELAVSGYPPEDLLLRPGFLYECEQAMGRIAAACRGITAVVGWPQAAGAVVYNAASVLRDGLVEQTYRKRELPNYALRVRGQWRSGGAADLRGPMVCRTAGRYRARRCAAGGGPQCVAL